MVIGTTANYDPVANYFDTRFVEQVSWCCPSTPRRPWLKSTVPVGYTESLCSKYPGGRFLFSPEFLREGSALFDNQRPSRIVVGAPEGALAGWDVRRPPKASCPCSRRVPQMRMSPPSFAAPPGLRR